jgi:DNA-binding NtrC family response regulator
MANPGKVTILVVDNDAASQETMRQMLDSEGWTVHVATNAARVLPALAKGEWTMVIANVALTGTSGPLFTTLRELALAPSMEDGKGRLRVLFLLPQTMGPKARGLLEGQRLPYVSRPFNLQDFLEKVSDLLIERGAIPNPIRRVRFGGLVSSRQSGLIHEQPRHHERGQGMFAKRSDYTVTEEEIAEYEKQEQEEQLRRRKKNKLEL